MSRGAKRETAGTARRERLLRLELTPEEARLLRRACERYLGTLPIYLQAVQEEKELLERVMARLGGSESPGL